MRGKGWVKKSFAIMIILAVFMALAGPAMAKGPKRVLIGFKTNSVHKNAEQRGNFVKDSGGKVHHSFKLISAVSAEMPEQAVAKMNTADKARRSASSFTVGRLRSIFKKPR